MTEQKRYWSAEQMTHDDFGQKFTNVKGEVVYDAITKFGGKWATMTQESYDLNSLGLLGCGKGQKYVRNQAGQLILVEGGCD